mgnify:FL=1
MIIPDKLTQVFFKNLFPLIDEIVFLGGRVNFESPYAVKGGTSMNGSVILVQRGLEGMPSVDAVLLRDMKKAFGEVK